MVEERDGTRQLSARHSEGKVTEGDSRTTGKPALISRKATLGQNCAGPSVETLCRILYYLGQELAIL